MSTSSAQTTPHEAVEAAAATIAQAARDQRNTEPDHQDFGPLHYAAEHVLDAVYALAMNLGAQIAHYGDDKTLRTDTNRTPEDVVASVLDHGGHLQAALNQARKAAHAMAEDLCRLAVVSEPDGGAQDRDTM